MKNNLLYAVVAASLFVLGVGVSYSLFTNVKLGSLSMRPTTQPTVSPTPGRKPAIDPSIPRTEPCPLNGQLYTAQEKAVWETRRPLAVMIENHLDSRPLSGLLAADIVYEAVAEGGITRTMGVFFCGVAAENVQLAPVRSARIYFVKLATEYDALYNHVGGAGVCEDPTVDDRAKALCFIRRNKVKDLDQFGLNFKTCHRLTNRLDHEVASEHTMACYTDELYKVAVDRGWTNVDTNLKKPVAWDQSFVSWKFKDDATTDGPVTDISYFFWDSNKEDYGVAWKYDPTTQLYARTNGGQPAIDLNYTEQVKVKTLIVQLVKQTGPLDEHKHMLYDVEGSDKALVFQDGTVTPASWTKKNYTSRTRYVDSSGKELQFNKGLIWISLIPNTNTVEYNK